MFDSLIGDRRPLAWVLEFWPVFATAFVSSLAATFLCERVAIRLGLLDRPDHRVKTHREPVAHLGGVAMLVGLTAGLLAGVYLFRRDRGFPREIQWQFMVHPVARGSEESRPRDVGGECPRRVGCYSLGSVLQGLLKETAMERREFVKRGVLGGTGIWLGANLTPAIAGSAGDLTAGDVHEYLRSLGREWIDPENTVDTFKSGRPETPVKGIAVGWLSYFDTLRQSVARGCNLFVTHEPTYYNHRDTDQSVFSFEVAARKRAFIEENGLTIIRCHDVWDRVPGIGIPDAWGRYLGWRKVVREQTFYRVYELPAVAAGELARQVAGKVASLGQTGVQLVGPADRVIRTVAIGTGAITSLRTMIGELKADIALCTDDGFTYWRDGAMAIDMGYPVIVVNHACSEEVGMVELANHLRGKYPAVPVHHIAQKCMFTTVFA